MTTEARRLARDLRRLDRRVALLLLVLLAAPTALLATARAAPALDPVFDSPSFHLYVVSAIAACA